MSPWPQNSDIFCAWILGLGLVGLFIVFVFFACAALYRVDSRAWIIVGIIANLLLLAYFVLGVVVNIMNLYRFRDIPGRQASAINQTLFSITLIFGLAALTNFLAAVFATIAILKSNVRRWYRGDA